MKLGSWKKFQVEKFYAHFIRAHFFVSGYETVQKEPRPTSLDDIGYEIIERNALSKIKL